MAHSVRYWLVLRFALTTQPVAPIEVATHHPALCSARCCPSSILRSSIPSKREEKVICEYIETAMRRAHYELIQDEEPFYGEVPELPGVWATGKRLEECREKLAEVVEGWILIRLARGLPIPPLGEAQIVLPAEMSIV